MMESDQISFNVMESYTRDMGRVVARIDKTTMKFLKISEGDVIEISGKKKAVAKCFPLYPADENKKIIRLDGLTRNNCQREIGESVDLKKIKTELVDTVIVIPLESIPPIDPRYLADALDTVPIILNQYLLVPYFGGRLTFEVVNTVPSFEDKTKALVVTQKTVFYIQKKKEQYPENGDISAKRHFILNQFVRLEDLEIDEFDELVKKLTKFYNELKTKKSLSKR